MDDYEPYKIDYKMINTKLEAKVIVKLRELMDMMIKDFPELCDGQIISMAVDPVDRYATILFPEKGKEGKYRINYAEFNGEEV